MQLNQFLGPLLSRSSMPSLLQLLQNKTFFLFVWCLFTHCFFLYFGFAWLSKLDLCAFRRLGFWIKDCIESTIRVLAVRSLKIVSGDVLKYKALWSKWGIIQCKSRCYSEPFRKRCLLKVSPKYSLCLFQLL